jgi:hypothetical protein
VTVDHCGECDAFWFDIEEIRRFVEVAHPDAAHVPDDADFREHTDGLGEACTCCGSQTLERGVAGRAEFRRCTWCGGLFLFRADLMRYELDGEDDRPDDEVWTLFGVLRDLVVS